MCPALCRAFLALLCASTSHGASSLTKPHVFLVLIDDLGWSNLGNRAGEGNGSASPEEAVTPNIDRLVRSGIKLNRHYTYNYCSPSRASLQSGRLPMHVSFNNDDPSTYNPSDPVSGFAGIPRNMTCLANKMKQAGYMTHMTGKWDAGMATWEHTPMGRGYDTWFGYYHHANDYYTQMLGESSTGSQDICQTHGISLVDLWNTTGPALGMNNTVYEEEMFAQNTLRVIQEHDTTKPLFLFHSFHLIHTPLEVPEQYEKQFSFLKPKPRALYAAMVHYMDHKLGLFVDALQTRGMWNNTLMVVSSDNGGPIYSTGIPIKGEVVAGAANNMPLKGGKLSDWEGGVRVNAFVSGGALPVSQRGTELDNYIHIADWYATLCHLAGVDSADRQAELAGLPPPDSINQWPLLSGASKTAARTDIFLSKVAYINGRYKLLTGNTVPGSWSRHMRMNPTEVPFAGYWAGYGARAVFKTLTAKQDCKGGCLYDIIADPYETSNVAEQQPELLQKMMTALDKLNEGIFLPDRGNQTMQSCTTGLNQYNGFYGPFVPV